MPRLIQRHDQFFKRLLDRPGTVAALLRERLPPEIAARLSDDPPQELPGSFIPPALREYRTDRLFLARLAGDEPLLVHAIVEHKSSPDRRTPVQIAGYKVRILEDWIETHGLVGPLPAVLSLVVYHGAAPWTVPLTLVGMVQADASLHPWLMNFGYVLVDLSGIADAALSGHRVLRTGLLILKYGTRDGDLREILRMLAQAAYALGWDDLVTLIYYILAEPNEVESQVLREVLCEIIPGQEERIMSIAAEQWMAEGHMKGRMEGLQEGRMEGQARTLLRLLERRFGPVPEAVQARVGAAGPNDLDLWTDRVLDAPDLETVFADTTAH